MGKKGFLRAALLVAMFVGLTTAASAQVTVSAGFAVSSMGAKVGNYSADGEIGFGGNVYVDYLLPISIPLSLGFEIGYDTASMNDDGVKVTGIAIPLLLRAAYHFDLMANLDLYLVGKVGYILGSAEYLSDTESGYNGIGFGFDVGAAYYFTSRIGVFAEAGFDRYNLKKNFTENNNYSYTLEVPFTRFVTLGISAKF